MKNKFLKIFKDIQNKNNIFVGFYGGGNYGDELLMEVLMNYKEVHKIYGDFLYLGRVDYSTFHKKFKYSSYFLKKDFLKKSLRSKNIIFGGGGIFSEDSSNLNLYLMIYLSFISVLLRKKVFLIGTGIYKETPHLKKILFLLRFMKAEIYIRDKSSSKVLKSGKVRHVLDNDLSWILNKENYKVRYLNDEKYIEDILSTEKTNIIVSVRRSLQDKNDNFKSQMLSLISKHYNEYNFIYWKMQEGDGENIPKGIKNIIENRNPLSILYRLKESNNKNIKIISPQFHGIITGVITNIDIFPLFYADKGKDLLQSLSMDSIKCRDVTYEKLITFIKKGNS